MEYRVEQLAAAAQIPVDTLRFYQARGLLPAPRREGRIAIYEDRHLERLTRIRSLQQQGFSLSQIQRVLEPATGESEEPLLAALLEESVGERTLSREAFAAESGMPEVMILAAERAGLFEPVAERLTRPRALPPRVYIDDFSSEEDEDLVLEPEDGPDTVVHFYPNGRVDAVEIVLADVDNHLIALRTTGRLGVIAAEEW